MILGSVASHMMGAHGEPYSTWIQGTIPVSGSWQTASFGNNVFSITGGGTVNAVSSDGIVWTSAPSTNQSAPWSSTFAGGQHVAISQNGGVGRRTSNGTIWSTFTTVASRNWYDIAGSDTLFVAISSTQGRVITSPNGSSWSETTVSVTGQSIAYGNGIFVAVNNVPGLIYRSTNGTTWNSVAQPIFLQSITFGNGIFLAAGLSDCATSPDGINWTVHPFPITYPADTILSCFGDNTFLVMCAGETTVLISFNNGVSWSTRTTPVIETWRDIAFGDFGFVIVNDSSDTTLKLAR